MPAGRGFVPRICSSFVFFFFNDTATTEIYTLSLHDALPNSRQWASCWSTRRTSKRGAIKLRSEEHTSELQSHSFISYAVFCLKKYTETYARSSLRPGRRQPRRDSRSTDR